MVGPSVIIMHPSIPNIIASTWNLVGTGPYWIDVKIVWIRGLSPDNATAGPTYPVISAWYTANEAIQ